MMINLNELKQYIKELEKSATESDEATETDEAAKSKYFYIGFLSALESVREYIETGRKREMV